MSSRALQLIIGVIFFLSSTPSGMAKEIIPGKARADFFVAVEASQAAVADDLYSDQAPSTRGTEDILLSGNALPAEVIGQESSNSPSSSGKQSKRQQRHNTHNQHSASMRLREASAKTSILLSASSARVSSSQDALQERTDTIRFVHLASDID